MVARKSVKKTGKNPVKKTRKVSGRKPAGKKPTRKRVAEKKPGMKPEGASVKEPVRIIPSVP